MVESEFPAAMQDPLGWNMTLFTWQLASLKVCTHSLVDLSQILIVLSSLPETNIRESGANLASDVHVYSEFKWNLNYQLNSKAGF